MTTIRILANIIKEELGSPFLDDIEEHASDHMKQKLKQKYVMCEKNAN